MNRLPKFSIVTPSFNQAEYISETLESVLSQEGEFDLEYFVMDGGSTDGSVEILKKYAERVKRGDWSGRCRRLEFHWVSEKDRGQTDAVNKGIRQSRGDYYSYINSDDLYFPGAFSKIAEIFHKHPEADLIFGDGDVIDEKGKVLWEWLSRPYRHSIMTSYHFLWNDFSNYIMQQATFWRRRVVNAIGEFDESFHYSMDVEYWVRAGARGLSLMHIPVKLGKFRMIPGTKSLSDPNVFWLDNMEILRRYNGAGSMIKYFQYFYYNAALHEGLDYETLRGAQHRLFQRWSTLGPEELSILHRCSVSGETKAKLMIAAVSFDVGDVEKAKLQFAQVFRNNPLAILSPSAWGILLRIVLGKDISSQWTTLKNRGIKSYREYRYHYRYREGRS